jgi:hypothetical protein
MRYIKTYEDKYRTGRTDEYKPPFKSDIKISKKIEPFKSFDFKQLYKECADYDVDFNELVSEILLNREIAFQSDVWTYNTFDENGNWKSYDQIMSSSEYKHKGVIDYCEDIKIFSTYVEDLFAKNKYANQEVLLKLKNTDDCVWLPNGKKIRVYNYTEGPCMYELELKKESEKYNL